MKSVGKLLQLRHGASCLGGHEERTVVDVAELHGAAEVPVEPHGRRIWHHGIGVGNHPVGKIVVQPADAQCLRGVYDLKHLAAYELARSGFGE